MAIATRSAAPAQGTNPAAPKARATRTQVQAKPAAQAPAQPSTLAPPPNGAGIASLNPSTFGQGGLIDDIDVTITDAAAVGWDYNGQQAMTPALAIEYTDPNGTQHTQYYSAGDWADWQPDGSNEYFVSVSGKTGFTNNTNIAMLLANVVSLGFPAEQLTGNVKVLIGIKGHVVQQVKERKGLIRTGKNADRPSSVLLFSKIYELPEGMATTTTAAAEPTVQAQPTAPAARTTQTTQGHVNGAAQANAGAGAGAGVDDSELQNYLLNEIMSRDGNVIEKKDIIKVIFNAATKDGKTDKERNKAVIRAGQQDFLAGLSAVGIEYTGTEIRLAQ